MKTLKFFGPLAVTLGMLGAPSVANAQSAFAAPATVHDFLTRPLVNPAAATLRITPPPGGQVMLHRQGKAARWFLQPGIIQVEPGVTYSLSAVRNGAVVFQSGIMARPGMMDVAWNAMSNAPDLTYHAPIVANPFGMGLVPMGSVPLAALRTTTTDAQYQTMLDDVQGQLTDPLRWMALGRYTQGFWFTDEQVQGIVDSFDTPRYQAAAARVLARRRVGN